MNEQISNRATTPSIISFSRLAALFAVVLLAGCASIRNSMLPDAGERESNQQLKNLSEQSSGDVLEALIAFETAKLAVERGMDGEAIEAFEKARKLKPDMRGVSHPLAVLYDRAGRVDAAEREYQLAMVENDGDADLHCDYGYFLYSTGSGKAAEAELRKAIRLAPKHRQSRVNLGLVLGAQGQFDEAEQLFTDAIGPAAAQHNLGMLKLRQGDAAAARGHLSRAIQGDPSLQQSRSVLANLNGAAPRIAENVVGNTE